VEIFVEFSVHCQWFMHLYRPLKVVWWHDDDDDDDDYR